MDRRLNLNSAGILQIVPNLLQVLVLKTHERNGSVNVKVRSYLDTLLGKVHAVQYSWTGMDAINGSMTLTTCLNSRYVILYFYFYQSSSLDVTKSSFRDKIGLHTLMIKTVKYGSWEIFEEKKVFDSMRDYFKRAKFRAGL